MVVLGRLEDERLLLDFRGLTAADAARLRAGEPIEVMVVRAGMKVRLGVEAPKSVTVTRFEVADAALQAAARPADSLGIKARRSA